jgi:hypothetical protein
MNDKSSKHLQTHYAVIRDGTPTMVPLEQLTKDEGRAISFQLYHESEKIHRASEAVWSFVYGRSNAQRVLDNLQRLHDMLEDADKMKRLAEYLELDNEDNSHSSRLLSKVLDLLWPLREIMKCEEENSMPMAAASAPARRR